jgi:polyphosphate kinase
LLSKHHSASTDHAPAGAVTDVRPQHFINRELSSLEFNRRVLEEACDPDVPLAERCKFQGIVASNLDEFFMVRVAGLKHLLAGGVADSGADGMLPGEQLAAICERTHEMVATLYRNFLDFIAPQLTAKAGLAILAPHQLNHEQKEFLQAHFKHKVWPVLTPLAVDRGHPFPVLRNRSLNLAIVLRKELQRVPSRARIFAVVQVPAVLKRLVEITPSPPLRAAFILLEDVIAMHVGELFPGFRVVGCHCFRVTRDFDLSLDEDDADDLLKTIQRELRRRERNQAVRLELADDTPAEVESFLRKALHLQPDDVYPAPGPLHLADLSPLAASDELRDCRDEAFAPQPVAAFLDADMFRVISERDVLLHLPYESFDHVVDFVSAAAADPDVLAIKQTLYRTSADSPIVTALTRAAENGKQVTAMIELRARFDEKRNITWARVLEEAGVHVVYGVVGLKTHCKASLVVRREGDAIRRYVHLSTGNYNPLTARTYGDISLFTAREAFADDTGAMFNLLTGYSAPPSWKRFTVAPLGLAERIVELIERERMYGHSGRIVAKMNALVDPEVIRALYRASQSGVSIDLLVRGICCLRPGIPGMSENIRVLSVVDRYLEHARIFHFHAGGRREVYLSSADWMPRNFVRRVEVMFPVDDESLRDRLIDEILAISREDNAKTRMLLPDGTYRRLRPGNGDPLRRSQQRFTELARQSAAAAPAQEENRDERVVPGRESSARSGVSAVQPALLGKHSLPS